MGVFTLRTTKADPMGIQKMQRYYNVAVRNYEVGWAEINNVSIRSILPSKWKMFNRR